MSFNRQRVDRVDARIDEPLITGLDYGFLTVELDADAGEFRVLVRRSFPAPEADAVAASGWVSAAAVPLVVALAELGGSGVSGVVRVREVATVAVTQ